MQVVYVEEIRFLAKVLAQLLLLIQPWKNHGKKV